MTKAINTPETAQPVHEVNAQIKSWIERMGFIWVEGQITQVNIKPTWKLSYLTLRDPEVEASVNITCSTSLINSLPHIPKDGDRVVVCGKPAFYANRGSFSLWVTDIRPVGIGELLARIEQLRHSLASEGLFDVSRKKPLPFLPRAIGLITGRGSAAERDVLSVAKDRWPEVQFVVENTAVQGATAVPEIITALEKLDAHPNVDVIIIARGGGSVEDLLPFSEEALQRAVAAAHTPVVSAIGHEPDTPILDNVADLRAATPTDAAKRVVPNVAAEREFLVEQRLRAAQALRGWVAREHMNLSALRSRPVLHSPLSIVTTQQENLTNLRNQFRRAMHTTISAEISLVESLRKQISALGPAATLARGYAVVQVLPRDHSPAEIVTSINQAPPGSQLRIRVADGSIVAAGMQTIATD
ncbi:exodeoxyribonuclease VII large subunit [Corynebacterium kutscheri]|uniref:Exodeoxyribonuclease 7 large subunit n=1 Tax=Corynebacterium kutscheri TaxID=35755 RepID=A0A0F6R0I3_9CORY|nr:exodeoxyribonuclease VII large subunit [Corynebacterium kutscheri]AKE41757.1 Exodeoxyribonuclease VII large subunit [Corynebacterium kutscheri]VEH09032.1 exodeoxyribonuclease VII large subunit [Corynebacterium kutscheri]VEH10083.1 exodeoxyribonuclease VII large subunit [Corynebacterium kutscheri]VEH80165.1 exodeoxyribonuclease VII large subunit [Corynebacterium kutscheri]